MVVMVEVMLQRCLGDGGFGSFSCFSLLRSFYTASVCSITSDLSRGWQKRQSFFSHCLKDKPDITVSVSKWQ